MRVTPPLAPEIAEQLEKFKKLISSVDVKSLEEIQQAMKKE